MSEPAPLIEPPEDEAEPVSAAPRLTSAVSAIKEDVVAA